MERHNNNNSSTITATSLLLIKDHSHNDNETTSLSTDVSLLPADISDSPITLHAATRANTTTNASVIIVGAHSNNNKNTVREWNLNMSINQQQTSRQGKSSNAIAFQRTPNASLQFQELGCLTHTPMVVNAQHVNVNQSISVLNLTLRDGCGPLRNDWRDNPPLSPIAKMLVRHQSNCSLPTITWHVDRRFGIGSHIEQWSTSLCRAWSLGMRLRTQGRNWIWLDHTYCSYAKAQQSPWLCYWPRADYPCHETSINSSLAMTGRKIFCKHFKKQARDFEHEFHSAAIEFMFQSVSPLVIQEAQRQVGVLFGPKGAPPDLITVHLRWGDKDREMTLLPAQDYVNAVTRLLHDELHRADNDTANIYLATEDPVAADAFLKAAPKTWKVYVDVGMQELSAFRPPPTVSNCATIMARNTRGRGGLVNVGSILVAMEANYYVLTSGSGFSRIMNRLRTQILNPRCSNCTRAINLKTEHLYGG